jgi:hypothetical protein
MQRTVRASTDRYSETTASCESCTPHFGSILARSFSQPHAISAELDCQAAGGLPGHLLLPVRIRLTVMAIGHMLTSVLRLGCFDGLAVA